MKSESRERLEKLLSRFRDVPLVVAGDLILDEFVWGRVERISPEAPVPVVEVTRESVRLGGAANVAANLAVMGAKPRLIGVLGRDRAGIRLAEELEAAGIARDDIMLDPDRQTSVKTRIIAHHQQVCRADRETRRPLSPGVAEQLAIRVARGLKDAPALILSDYGKGVLGGGNAAALIEVARGRDRFCAVDPKAKDFSVYRSASIITPNKKEAEQASGITIDDESSLLRAGRLLLEQTGAGWLLVTRGEEGMTLLEPDGEFHIPTMAREVFDVTGAGDTVVATLALAVAAGGTVRQSALLANCAAGVVVAKLGTAAATVQEMETALAQSPLDS